MLVREPQQPGGRPARRTARRVALITFVRPASRRPVDQRLEQHAAEAAPAQLGLDGRERPGLVEVVQLATARPRRRPPSGRPRRRRARRAARRRWARASRRPSRRRSRTSSRGGRPPSRPASRSRGSGASARRRGGRSAGSPCAEGRSATHPPSPEFPDGPLRCRLPDCDRAPPPAARPGGPHRAGGRPAQRRRDGDQRRGARARVRQAAGHAGDRRRRPRGCQPGRRPRCAASACTTGLDHDLRAGARSSPTTSDGPSRRRPGSPTTASSGTWSRTGCARESVLSFASTSRS